MCLDAPKPAVQELPASLTWAQIAAACKDGRKLMVINGEVRSGRRDVGSTCAERCAARRVADDGAQRCAPPGDRCNRDLCALLQVYDVAGWVQKHPGGKVLLTYVGEDATDSVRAFHRDEEQMQKYLSPLRVAALAQEAPAAVRPLHATRYHIAPHGPFVAPSQRTRLAARRPCCRDRFSAEARRFPEATAAASRRCPGLVQPRSTASK